MSYKVGKPEGLNFSGSEDERGDDDGSPRRSRRRRPRPPPSPRRAKSPDPDHPSWGFGNSRGGPTRGTKMDQGDHQGTMDLKGRGVSLDSLGQRVQR